MSASRLFAFICLMGFTCNALSAPKRVHVFVALADNEHQGIAKVPAKIGNGDEAGSNLYWGTTDAIILCCLSARWFKPHLEALKVSPVLTTEQFMYPGSFLLRDALEVWLRGGSRSAIRLAAARAYATNQKISVKAAAGVFTKLE